MAWDDKLALVNSAGFGAFGRAVVYKPPTPPGGPDVVTIGVFRQTPDSLDFQDGTVESVDARVDLRRESVPGGPITGARIIAQGDTFEVINVEGPSDGNVCRLRLKRV